MSDGWHKPIFLADEAATVAAGCRLGKQLPAGIVIFLEGPLGAGKTTITRGILQALGHSATVKSPTYTLVEPYHQLSPVLYHFDLYRLGDAEELAYMGIRDYFSTQTICVVEWAERGEGYLPAADISLKLSLAGAGQTTPIGRSLQLVAHSRKGQQASKYWG